MENITFNPVEEKDFEMMHRRLQEEHIQWFYDGWELSLDEYSEWMMQRMENIHQFPYICEHNGVPIWYIQCYDCYGLAEDVYGELVESWTRWVDMYIWEPTYIWKWYGSKILKSFVEFVQTKHGATYVSIDPTPDNHRATRAYTKAWFEAIKEFEIDGNVHMLMLYIA